MLEHAQVAKAFLEDAKASAFLQKMRDSAQTPEQAAVHSSDFGMYNIVEQWLQKKKHKFRLWETLAVTNYILKGLPLPVTVAAIPAKKAKAAK